MADFAGILTMLAMGTAVVGVLLGLQRALAPRSDDAPPASVDRSDSADPAPPSELAPTRGGPETRLRVGFAFGALVFLVGLAGLIGLLVWALAARSLGNTGLVGFVAFALPLVIAVLHAYSRDSLEW